LAKGELPEALALHLSECSACAEVQMVWAYLRQSIQNDSTDALPAPGLIWWRGQLAAQRALAKRSVAPIRVMQSTAVVIAAVLIVLLLGAYPQIFAQVPHTLLFSLAAIAAVSFPIAGCLYFWARYER
jgi:hypothetical protein